MAVYDAATELLNEKMQACEGLTLGIDPDGPYNAEVHANALGETASPPRRALAVRARAFQGGGYPICRWRALAALARGLELSL